MKDLRIRKNTQEVYGHYAPEEYTLKKNLALLNAIKIATEIYYILLTLSLIEVILCLWFNKFNTAGLAFVLVTEFIYFSYLKQMLVSLGSGPWDQLFGGGNSPAFAVAAIAALVSGIIAVFAIPRTSSQKPRSPV